MATNNALNNAMIAFINDDTFAAATTTSGASSSSIKNYVDAKFETGTFSPDITFVTPGDLSVSYSTRFATYNRIITPTRRLCFYQIQIVTNNFTFSTASGNFRIINLPFASSSTYSVTGVIGNTANISFGTDGAAMYPLIGAGNTHMSANTKAINVNSTTVMNISNFTSGSNPAINISGFYYTN